MKSDRHSPPNLVAAPENACLGIKQATGPIATGASSSQSNSAVYDAPASLRVQRLDGFGVGRHNFEQSPSWPARAGGSLGSGGHWGQGVIGVKGVIGVRSCNHANASLQDLTRGPTLPAGAGVRKPRPSRRIGQGSCLRRRLQRSLVFHVGVQTPTRPDSE